MKEAFGVTVEVEDNFSDEVLVQALPPIGAMLKVRGKGAFKVKEIEFTGAPGEEMKIVLRCVPILAF